MEFSTKKNVSSFSRIAIMFFFLRRRTPMHLLPFSRYFRLKFDFFVGKQDIWVTDQACSVKMNQILRWDWLPERARYG